MPGRKIKKRPDDPLPETWLGHIVTDADETDIRFEDSAGIVAGLRFKFGVAGTEAWFEGKRKAGSFVWGLPPYLLNEAWKEDHRRRFPAQKQRWRLARMRRRNPRHPRIRRRNPQGT